MIKTAVLGAGSWGTAIAVLLAKKGTDVTLWEFFKENAEQISADRENKKYLPGTILPDNIICTNDLKIIGKDELGLIFECTNLDPETKRCKIHFWRPGICRRYPQEELFSMGGTLSDDCGYKMEPIIPFKDVLKTVEKHQNRKIIRKWF